MADSMTLVYFFFRSETTSSRLWIQLFNSLRADLRQDIRRYLAYSMCLEEIAPLSHCTLTQMKSVNNIKYISSLLG